MSGVRTCILALPSGRFRFRSFVASVAILLPAFLCLSSADNISRYKSIYSSHNLFRCPVFKTERPRLGNFLALLLMTETDRVFEARLKIKVAGYVREHRHVYYIGCFWHDFLKVCGIYVWYFLCLSRWCIDQIHFSAKTFRVRYQSPQQHRKSRTNKLPILMLQLFYLMMGIRLSPETRCIFIVAYLATFWYT